MKISVCMATYNGEKYIKEQIDSILSQLNENDELIISDDFSFDTTLKIISEIKDRRIKSIVNKKNEGFVSNFEKALEIASGDVIFLSDQDDVWMPNKVELMLRELEKYDFVVSDCITINNTNKVIGESRFKEFNIKTGFINIMIRSRYLGCCMAFRKNVLKASLPFPKRKDLYEHDTWLATVAECYFKTGLVYEPLIKYRRHESNVSSGGWGYGYSPIKKITSRFYRIFSLMRIYPKIRTLKR